MQRRETVYFLIIVIICFLLREEIYSLLYYEKISSKISDNICTIKNKTLEESFYELTENKEYFDLPNYNYETSKILYRDIYDLNDTMTIYKGYVDNIKKDNLVVNEYGLVGVVSKVLKNTSIVKLLPNKDLNMSVKVGNSYGVLKYVQNEFAIVGINNTEKIDAYTSVFTSDISIYPENILIGTVKSVENDNYNIEKKIIVEPKVDFNKIKYVSIITDLRGTK